MKRISNPILRGFCPDPSIIRVGDDYYIAVSTFEWWPGVALYHSRDLEHWRQLPSPLTRPEQLDMRGNPVNGGVWAPALSFHEGRFYLVYTDTKTQKHQFYNTHNYLVWADSIEGPWSDPVYLHSLGFDPSLFHDGERCFLLSMRNGFRGILLQAFDRDRLKLVGKVETIFEGTNLDYTEGPHIYRRGEYYYLVCAEGGTGYGHAVTIARARDIRGPYEVDPENPILTTRHDPDYPLQRAGHASLVEQSDGSWLLAHLCSRPILGHSILGRETALQNVYWTEDDWLRLDERRSLPALSFTPPAHLLPAPMELMLERDDFSRGVSPLYRSMRGPIKGIETLERGGLRLSGRESMMSNFDVTLLARRQTEFIGSASTQLRCEPRLSEHMAGLAYLYNNENFLLLVLTLVNDCEPVIELWRCERAARWQLIAQQVVSDFSVVRLRVDYAYLEARFSYALDERPWRLVGDVIDTRFLSDEVARGFTGAHIGLYVHDTSGAGWSAEFDYLEVIERRGSI